MRSIATALCFAVTAIYAIAGERANSVDSCRAQIPASLTTVVAMKFPGYRTPLESDNQPEDIQYNRQHGGMGCLGVAHGDFFGGGNRDFLLGLTALKGQSGLVVVASPSKGGWSFQELGPPWENYRSSLYVDVEIPGRYQRTPILDGPLEGGEARSMRCKHQGAGFGETGASEIVYCFNGTKWRHVQISD